MIDDEIRIISDTKITDSGVLHPTLLDGGLKCIAISPTCCVCFAGKVAVAEEALAPILNHTMQDRQQITTHLLQHHKAAQGEAVRSEKCQYLTCQCDCSLCKADYRKSTCHRRHRWTRH
jgi:hypothetical protein